ncbi:MAG: 6-bladed beta-propeller [Acidobacteriota bacterium]|nr:6-bladed beta-propeller [Acidobacteriota bacterium]
MGPDGSIFVKEQEQLLKFDRAGKFVRNFFRKGQGPGEVQYISGFLPIERGLIVHGIAPGKLIWYDEDGVLTREIPLQIPQMMNTFLGSAKDGLAFMSMVSPFSSPKGGSPAVVEVAYNFYIWKEGEAEEEKIGSFPVDMYVIQSNLGRGGGILPVGQMIAVLTGNGRLVLSHTQEYLIKIFDFETKAVIRTFRRSYERNKFEPPKKGGVIINGQAYTHAPRKYASDIEALFAVEGRLWVATSKRDKDGNPSIDVFDFDGRYLDRFYLRLTLGEAPFALYDRDYVIRGGFLYRLERKEDDTSSVVKYEIKDPGAPGRGK